jgi:hypothetical protein
VRLAQGRARRFGGISHPGQIQQRRQQVWSAPPLRVPGSHEPSR